MGKQRTICNGYALEKLTMSDNLKAFIDRYFETTGETRTGVARIISNEIIQNGYKRGLSTICIDMDRGSVPSGLASIYLKVFHDLGYIDKGKPFFEKSEIIELEKTVEVEKVIEVEKVVEKTVTAKGDDWDHVALFKLVSQLPMDEYVYLTMLVDDQWYAMQAKSLLKRGLIKEEDINYRDKERGIKRRR